ncbi:MAG: peptidase [Verrucomicrobiaceae bacterium]|nr:peptidase [Verrucomicrobiaceae bacterium]
MPNSSRRRLIGLETEYGCLVEDNLPMHQVIGRLRDWFFENQRHGLIDVHHRDWDEPPGNGGFLFNGGRMYEDMGHLEMCTPECSSFLEVVHYDRANDHLLAQALHELELDDTVSIIRNNIDHYTGATFGCHENYSLDRQAVSSDEAIFSLLTFLTLRSLYTGAGRVGGLETQRQLMRQEREPLLDNFDGFQITQRADYVENDFFRWVQGNRAIINTRDEPLADPTLYRRLHLLHGDTNVLPGAAFLKIGTTALILDLLEIDDLPMLRLHEPVSTLKQISYQAEGPWQVFMNPAETCNAVDVLEIYRERAAQHFTGRDTETDALLDLWKRANEAFASNDPTGMVGILDWVTKRYLFQHFCEAERIDLNNDWLQAQDLEYHHISPERSLAHPLAKDGHWSLNLEAAVKRCLTEPPPDTRALARSRFMRQIDPLDENYIIDWDCVRWADRMVAFPDPYELHPTVTQNPDELTDNSAGWPEDD